MSAINKRLLRCSKKEILGQYNISGCSLTYLPR
jgi:hypothetical protein